MAEQAYLPAIKRIDRAIARIEAAAADHARAVERIADRHSFLRERIAEAVASIDTLIAREKDDE